MRRDPSPSRVTKADLASDLALTEQARRGLSKINEGLAIELAECRNALDRAGVPKGTLRQRLDFLLHDLDRLRNRVAAQPEPWGTWLARMAWGIWQ